MGKNDLWIATTASLLNLMLITTDDDFDHLNNHFLQIRKITSDFLKAFFKK
jgi:tRNA(fMet)-specific endonuclease VapC